MKKILVANRGEIALRVMRSANEMGIRTVAVFSEADRNALHVRFADEAVCIGPPPSNQSYLLGDKILEICKNLHVDAVHPGYGFLSENADFARKVEKAGIIFIGPPASAMDMMGSKLAAKETAAKFNVPMVPGADKAISGIEEARTIAAKTGYPILIKASAGGGGKGMRVVDDASQLEEQLNRASSEALSAFGDGSVFIEKYVQSPRHIEIQILADQHGNCVYLFERECSIQRRHQKLVEEAPSSVLTPDLRKKMGESAVMVAKACGYVGAGTVEFLVDEKLNFYFLEMNTRLQVEHPVTEMITELDLVKEQIKIARGEKLSFAQADLEINGHAIELRVCAEDPLNNFLPDTGDLKTYKLPNGTGVRVDSGFEEGMTVPVYYDSLLAKLIVWGADRTEAIERMKRAIDEYHIVGIKTTLPFGKFVMNHPAFIIGEIDTNFIPRYYKPEMLMNENEEEAKVAAMIAAKIFSTKNRSEVANGNGIDSNGVAKSNWKKRLQED